MWASCDCHVIYIQFVESLPRTPEIDEFLKKIGPYDEEDESFVTTTEAAGGSGREEEHSNPTLPDAEQLREEEVEEGGGGDRADVLGDDVETDHPSQKKSFRKNIPSNMCCI